MKCLAEYSQQLEIINEAISKLKKGKGKAYPESALKNLKNVLENLLQVSQSTDPSSSIVDKTVDSPKRRNPDGCVKQLESLFKVMISSFGLCRTMNRVVELLLNDEHNKIPVRDLLKEFPTKKINKHHLNIALQILLTANIIEADDTSITLKQ
ncbi:hypothetical protein BDF20DRAFT_272532 [Mycotypha africana]|uniref:uncharacterized protein n=1 Tax=Mycotypha africana TaxID=64632 RepID=UPI0023014962|nr:uncharacterized protein BDF20DRAFT_272532 [Mycotypha africana]KAI8987527.1 hypothetical protein BDF20DRAFT_272532 [Mycotypha africana]